LANPEHGSASVDLAGRRSRINTAPAPFFQTKLKGVAMFRKTVCSLLVLLFATSFALAEDLEGKLRDVNTERKTMIFQVGETYKSLPSNNLVLQDKNGNRLSITEVPGNWRGDKVRITFRDVDKKKVATTVRNLDKP
jgi:hypothetical protein